MPPRRDLLTGFFLLMLCGLTQMGRAHGAEPLRSRLVEVQHATPWDQAVVDLARPPIAVSFRAKHVQEGSARLSLDGLDVTSQTTVRAHCLIYIPSQSLKAGLHRITLSYRTPEGAERLGNWPFEVLHQPIPADPAVTGPFQQHDGRTFCLLQGRGFTRRMEVRLNNKSIQYQWVHSGQARLDLSFPPSVSEPLIVRNRPHSWPQPPRYAFAPEDPFAFALFVAETQENAGAIRAVLELYAEAAPDDPEALNRLAWELLVSMDKGQRDPDKALHLARRAAALTRYRQAHLLHTLALAFFETGHINLAVEAEQEALQKLGPTASAGARRRMERALNRYRDGKKRKAEAHTRPTRKPLLLVD